MIDGDIIDEDDDGGKNSQVGSFSNNATGRGEVANLASRGTV